MNSSTDRIRSRTEAFVDDLVHLIRANIADAVRTMGTPGLSPASRGSKSRTRSKGQRRSADEIARTAAAILAFIEKHPGTSIEKVSAALGQATADLTLPMKKLLADKMLAKRGQKRGTRYSARSRG